MGRPRKFDTHLPVGVYFKHGAYYKVVRGIWHRLGATPDEANAGLRLIPNKLGAYKAEVLASATMAMGRAKQNARGHNRMEFSLTLDDLHRMLNEAGWRCAVTGTYFSLEMIAGRKPFAPSIDRVDNGKGYVPGNCRVVCVAANYGMNVWGEEVLKRLLRATKKRAASRIDDSLKGDALHIIEK